MNTTNTTTQQLTMATATTSLPYLLCLLCTTLLLKSSIALSSHLKPKLLILGLGRVGSEVASLTGETYDVIGTVRPEEIPNDSSVKDKSGLSPGTIQKLCFSPSNIRTILPSCSHVLVTLPASSQDNESIDLEQVYDDVVHFLPEKSWIGILSTTGVYGHHDGQWVDEDAVLLCQEGTSASAFRDFEVQWQRRVEQSDRHHRLYIFRCAGIYGPDSSALHTLYKRGIPPHIASPPNKHDATTDSATRNSGITNRIHVRDIAVAVQGAMTRQHVYGNNQRSAFVYNLADDLPESRAVVMRYAVKLFESINASLTTNGSTTTTTTSNSSATCTASSTRRARRRSTELKLVSNKRTKNELLPEGGLMFPTYVEGLHAILTLPDMPWSSPARQNKT